MSPKVQDSAVVFTLFYPYSTFDYYVDIEIEMICSIFKKVYIIPISIEKTIERRLPNNAELIESRFTASPFNALLQAILSGNYWSEISLAIKHKKLNKDLFKHLTLQHAKVNFLKQLLLRRLKLDANITWVYSHWLLEGVYAASQIKEKYNFQLISKAHSLDIYKERHINEYIPFLENAVPKLDQIHFISDLGKQYFNQNYQFKIPNHKQFVSRLGIQNQMPLKNFTPKDVLKIISVSYIYPLKRVDLILEAIAQIDDFSIEWHHIGAYYENHTQNIKQKAKELLKHKPNINVVWLGDYSIPQVYDYYEKNEFDLFVSASSSEGIPVSMMECMSFGIPVLSTNVGGVKEIVEDKINGFMVNANPNSIEISDTIKKYQAMSNDDKINMRQKAYQKWKTIYNAETNFKKFLNIAIPSKNDE
ncbi:MAG TPA: glycosyltransferase [Bacteroidia bacterium]|nr:glycosyltransferase [Bacteroidia bacterium]